jgi:hypothetical protein
MMVDDAADPQNPGKANDRYVPARCVIIELRAHRMGDEELNDHREPQEHADHKWYSFFHFVLLTLDAEKVEHPW